MEKLAAGQSVLPTILAILAGGGIGSQLSDGGDSLMTDLMAGIGGGMGGAGAGAFLSMLASRGRGALPIAGRGGVAGGGIGATAGSSFLHNQEKYGPRSQR